MAATKLEYRKIALVILLLILLYWLLLPSSRHASRLPDIVAQKGHPIVAEESQTHEVDGEETRNSISDFERKINQISKQLENKEVELHQLQKKHQKVVDDSAKVNALLQFKEQELDTAKHDLNSAKFELNAKKAEEMGQPFAGEKLVHFDLKGAPPKIDYLLKIIAISRQFGATGFLIEYEDMFPWKDDLSVLRQPHAYTEQEIKTIVTVITSAQMTLIPLVQSFGHLEFALKHDTFKHLRETDNITNSVCPLKSGSVELIKSMIKQVYDLHHSVKWFHLGGDEVWNIKTCSQCSASALSAVELYKHHILPIAKFVHTLPDGKGSSVMPIIWDDMMRKWEVSQLKEMAAHVTPMVWAYQADLSGYTHFPGDMWDRYTKSFPKIWLASSFKGALKAWTNFVPSKQHIENHRSWLEITKSLQEKKVNVAGIVLTGWSRFDHYGPLCELLPAAIPTLGVCLAVLDSGHYSPQVVADVSRRLGFKKPFNTNVNYFKRYQPEVAAYVGSDVYTLVGSLENALGFHFWGETRYIGWTRPYHLSRSHVSFFHLNETLNANIESHKKLLQVKSHAFEVLSKYFDEDTVNEWIVDKIDYYLNVTASRQTELRKLMKSVQFH